MSMNVYKHTHIYADINVLIYPNLQLKKKKVKE